MKANIKGLIDLLNPDLNEIVFGKQISESPPNPYASFRFISGPRLGRPFKSETYDGVNKPNVVTEHLQTQRLLMLRSFIIQKPQLICLKISQMGSK